MNFRERLEQSRDRFCEFEGNSELDEMFSCEYFATDNIKSLPACLDLRFPDGSRKAMPYNYFVEIDFLSAEMIEIITTTKQIKIIGRDLGKLYDFLVAYRVRYIATNVGADLNETGLFVEQIIIKEIS